MANVAIIEEKLLESDGTLYKVLELKVSTDASQFTVGSTGYSIWLDDGVNVVRPFAYELSGNLKSIRCVFTVDSFTNMGTIVAITIESDRAPIVEVLGFDLNSLISLSPYHDSTTYTNLDSATLNGL